MDLCVDATRVNLPETGIYVRALTGNPQFGGGVWGSHDIAHLTRESLLVWLRSRGGENAWAENVVGILLGHGHIVNGGPIAITPGEPE